MLRLLLIRLFLLAALFAGLWIARNTIVEKSLVAYVRDRTGLHVQVETTHFEPQNGSVQFRGVRIPDPAKMDQDFLSVESVAAFLNTGEFLKRQYNVKTVELRGIHYKPDDSDSALFVPKDAWNRFKERFPDWFSSTLDADWGAVFSGNLDSDTLRQLESEFQSARFYREMSEKWTAETKPMLERIDRNKARVQRIQAAIQQGKNQANPLESLASVLQETAELDKEIRTLAVSISTLEEQATKDAITLKSYFKEDFEKIKELKPPKFDAAFFSEVLIGPELKEQFATTLAWTESVRSYMDKENDSRFRFRFGPSRQKGTEVVFDSRKDQPDFLINKTVFDGEAVFGPQPVCFFGRVYDFAQSPRQWKNASTLQLCIDSRPVSETDLEESPLGADPLESFVRTEPIFAMSLGTDAIKRSLLNQLYREVVGLESELLQGRPVELVGPDGTPYLYLSPPSSLPVGTILRKDPKIMDFAVPPKNQSVPRIFLTAILDRRGDTPRDRIFVACPKYVVPRRVLGKPNQLAFEISPGVSQVYLELQLEDERISGRLRMSQYPVRIKPILPEKLRGSPLEKALHDYSNQVDSIDSELSIGGTLEKPVLAFRSDFGNTLVAGLESTLLNQWNQSRTLLAQDLNEKTNDSLLLVGNLFRTQFPALLQDVQAAQTQLPKDRQSLNRMLETEGRAILDSTIQGALQGDVKEGLKKGLLDSLNKLKGNRE